MEFALKWIVFPLLASFFFFNGSFLGLLLTSVMWVAYSRHCRRRRLVSTLPVESRGMPRRSLTRRLVGAAAIVSVAGSTSRRR